MIIGLHALDLVPKKAAGTAAGFTGFFGYVFGSAIAGTGVGWIADHWGWSGVFVTMVVCCVLTIGVQRDDAWPSGRERNSNSALNVRSTRRASPCRTNAEIVVLDPSAASLSFSSEVESRSRDTPRRKPGQFSAEHYRAAVAGVAFATCCLKKSTVRCQASLAAFSS